MKEKSLEFRYAVFKYLNELKTLRSVIRRDSKSLKTDKIMRKVFKNNIEMNIDGLKYLCDLADVDDFYDSEEVRTLVSRLRNELIPEVKKQLPRILHEQ